MSTVEKIMTPDCWRVIKYCEKYWHTRAEIPSMETLARKLKLQPAELQVIFSNEAFQTGWEVRGMPWQLEDQSVGIGLKATDHQLTAEQVTVANVMLNVMDPRTPQQRLRDMGINPVTYASWGKQKAFVDYVTNKGEELFGQHMGDVHRALTNQAVEGNMQAIKFWYEISGRYDSSKTVEAMNIRFVMERVIHVIQRYVKDPRQLEAIAKDFDEILNDAEPVTKAIR